MHTLTQLHAELAGKIETNRKSGDKLRSQMVQVEAVMKMLDPDFNARAISAKRRNTGNPWFKRGTLYIGAPWTCCGGCQPPDGAADIRSAFGRKDSSSPLGSRRKPTGGLSCCAAGTERKDGGW